MASPYEQEGHFGRRFRTNVANADAQYERLRRFLCCAREKSGLTQVELARRLGRPQSFVSKYENGARALDLIEAVEIVQAVGRNAVDLLEIFDE